MPKISVIIPSLHGSVGATVESVERQTVADWELIVVRGERPAARARNLGVAQASGEFLLFVDDDAALGHPHVLEQLLAAACRPGVGVVGTSKILPPDSSRLQQRIAREVPRWVFPVQRRSVVSNPPLTSYGFTAATTTCCLIPRAVLDEVGGFDERLSTGEDTELFYRIRQAGYRFVVPAECWAYHAPPASLRGLVEKSFRYGVGNALEARLEPSRNMNVIPLERAWARLALVFAPLLFLPSIFFSIYLEPRVHVRFGFRPLKAVATFATLSGYVWGYLRRDA